MIEFSTNGKYFRAMFNPLIALIDECKLNITPEGIDTKAVDRANVAMVILNLPKHIFQDWNVDESRTFGLELARIAQATGKNLNKTDSIKASITMETVKEPAGREVINSPLKEGERPEYRDIMKEVTKGNMRLSIDGFNRRIALGDPEQVRKEPKIPKLLVEATVTMPAARFKRIINRANAVGEYITLSIVEKEMPTFRTETIAKKFDGDTEESETNSTQAGCKIKATKDKVKALYSLDYLSSIAKILAADSEVRLKFATDYPITIEFPICSKELDGEGGLGSLLLAPRVEPE